MPVVVIFVLGQDTSQVRQIPDKSPIQDLPSAGADPSFHDRVRARCPHRSLDGPDADALEHRVEGGSELGVAIAEEELDRLGTPVKVHQKIPRLLGDPCCGWMGSAAYDADPPGGVFNDGQAVHLRTVQQVDGEEVGSDDRFGLGAQELCPRRPGPSRRRVDSGPGEDLQHRRGGDPDAHAGEFAVDSPVSPGLVLPGQPENQATDAASDNRAT